MWMFVYSGVDRGFGVLTGAVEHGSTVRQQRSREQVRTSFACKALKTHKLKTSTTLDGLNLNPKPSP